jgi:hypothetical protein
MIMLKATLVAMTLIRPWRTGWSADRGVDFSLRPVARSAPLPTAVGGDPVPAEQASFIDEDETASLIVSGEQARIAPAMVDVRPETASRETPGLQAWWSVSGKPSDS